MEQDVSKLNLGEGDADEARAAAEPGAAETAATVAPVPTTVEMSMLSALIRRVFHENAMHREMTGVDAKLLAALRASKAEYSEEEKRRFAEAGLPNNIYVPLTITKIRAAESQLSEVFTAPGDKAWTLEPTPMPEVPESVAREEFQRIVADYMKVVSAQIEMAAARGEEPDPSMLPDAKRMFDYAQARMDEVYRKQIEWAKKRAERMERVVYDQTVEGGLVEALKNLFHYLPIYGTAAIVGPTPRVMMRKKVRETKLGTYKYTLEPTEVLCFETVSPWDLYPRKGATRVEDGYLCIRRRFATEELWRFASKKADNAADGGGWFAGTVEALLERYPEGGAKIDGQPYDLVRSILENDGPSDANRCTMEGVEFFGNVRGSVLQQLYITTTSDGGEIDPAEFYEVDAIDIAGYVVYCKVIDPCIGRPVSKGVFYAEPGSWWGGNIPERLDATQRVVNAALRNLVNNMAMASGPMLYLKDAQRLTDKTPDAMKIRPWKVLKFDRDAYGQTDVPVGVLNFDSHVMELLRVFDWAKQQSDDDSGIPSYTYGMNVTGGALRTSSGLTMMLSEANRVMKAIEVDLDTDVLRDLIRRTVAWNMVYGRDVSVKGDCEVKAAGVMGLVLREAESTRRKQMMQLSATPAVMQIVGPKPLAALYEAELRSGDYGIRNLDDAIPTKEALEEEAMLQKLERLNRATAQQAAMAQAQQAAGEDAGGGPAGVMPGNMDAANALSPQAAPEDGGTAYAPPAPNQMIIGEREGVAARRGAA